MNDWITIKICLDQDKNEVSRYQLNETTTDSSGNILDETEYNEDGSISCKRIYRYFDDGSVKEYVEYDPMNELIERHVYHENEAGEVDRVVYEYGDGHILTKQFHFSDLGLAEKATLYDEHDQVVGYETYVLNETGEVIERIDSAEDNVESLRYQNAYDGNGNVLEEKKFVEGELTEVTHYAYDSNGKVVRKELSNKKDGFQVIDEYMYDDRGNQVYNSTFHSGTLVFENKCTYDQDNNLLTEEFFEIDFWEKKVIRNEKLLHVARSKEDQ